jgi:hypothetical protein
MQTSLLFAKLYVAFSYKKQRSLLQDIFGIAESSYEFVKFALTLALSQRAREYDFWLPSPVWGEGEPDSYSLPSWARAGVKAKQPCSGRNDLIHLLNPDLVVVEILALHSLAD